MTPRAHAEALVRCFTNYVARRDDAPNREHLRVASEWLRLLDADEPAVGDIEAVAVSVQSLEFVGSATIDLQLGVRAWASRARRQAILRRSAAG